MLVENRIAPLDALRTFAALGVVWIHSWIFTGNPSLKVFNVDLYRLIAIVGNGVNFFFVISGFFMFMVLSRKTFCFTNYTHFIYNRWRRIAPAYYVSALVYSMYFLLLYKDYPFFKLILVDFSFFNNLFHRGNIISPYWSLGTEWHFYLLLPLLFFTNSKKISMRLLCLFALASYLFLVLISRGILNEDFWRAQLPARFIEFSWGCLAGYLYINQLYPPNWMRSVKGIVLALFITYTGRILMVTEVIDRFGELGWLSRSLAEPVMTFGFAWFMYLMIVEKNRLSKMLSNPLFTYLGKLSYSIYLWHTFILILMAQLNFVWTTTPSLNCIFVFLITAALSIFIAHFSYALLEAPYFKSKKT